MKISKTIFSAILMSFMLPILNSADNLSGEPVVPPDTGVTTYQVNINGPSEVLPNSTVNYSVGVWKTITQQGGSSSSTPYSPVGDQCQWTVPSGFNESSVENATSIQLTTPSDPIIGTLSVNIAGKGSAQKQITVIGTDIDVDSNYDGIIDDLDDYTEDDTQGGLVFVDRYTRVDLKNNIPSDAGGLVTLEFWGAGKASAFRPDNTPIDSISWNPGGSPTYIYIRGDHVSDSQGDVVLTYKYIRNGVEVELASDIINLTVVDIDTYNIYPNSLELGESTCISYEISASFPDRCNYPSR